LLSGLFADSAFFFFFFNLISTCYEVLPALQQVAEAVSELKIFDMAESEEHPAHKALDEAKEHINACFAAFHVRGSCGGPIPDLLMLSANARLSSQVTDGASRGGCYPRRQRRVPGNGSKSLL
jgi:hypothetical protein